MLRVTFSFPQVLVHPLVMETAPLLPKTTQDVVKISVVGIAHLRYYFSVFCRWMAFSTKFLSIFFSIALCTYASHRDSLFEYNDDVEVGGTNEKGRLEDEAIIFYVNFAVGIVASTLGVFIFAKCDNIVLYFMLTFLHMCLTYACMAVVTYREAWFAFNMIVVSCVLDLLNLFFSCIAILTC